jgi:multiple sugar transport system ATP-binding protein
VAHIQFQQVKKFYPNGFVAIDDLNLEIYDNEFLVLLGPSGCGKSTTLNMIAGLEDISAGTLSFNGQVINDVSPDKRDIAMVFQSYALYPHKTVYENIAFGLKMRKFSNQEIKVLVDDAARRLDITKLLDRRPGQLSGGQRQRVALGRAMVRRPSAFLMDEPLSNLDAALRISMRAEIKQLHQNMQTTFIYVTHDQAEALTLADRIVVMKDGQILQIGTPDEIYEHPKNIFVASFLGVPQINLIEGNLLEEGGQLFFQSAGIRVNLAGINQSNLSKATSSQVTLGIRAEDVLSVDPSNGEDVFTGKIKSILPIGSDQFLEIRFSELDQKSYFFRVGKEYRNVIDGTFNFQMNVNRLHIFDTQTTLSLI